MMVQMFTTPTKQKPTHKTLLNTNHGRREVTMKNHPARGSSCNILTYLVAT